MQRLEGAGIPYMVSGSLGSVLHASPERHATSTS
jgi:hypothetical protein